MKRLTAFVSGKVQRVGYRARVIQLANGLGLKGIIENLSDGRVRIIAEGDEEKMKLFEGAIDIKNTFIQVTSIEKIYSQPYGEFGSFYKLVGTGETDSRLDEGIGVLKDMRDLLISICGMQKQMLGKQDQMLGKQDETLFEIKDMNSSLNDKMEKVLDKSDIIELKGDVSEMKSALRAKGII
ncbi:MAG: acylphosphatase [Methanothrix sp.]|nr:acylphosphatase [Methanothrix sp.]